MTQEIILTPGERSEIVSKSRFSGFYLDQKSKYVINVLSIDEIPGGVQVFVKASRDGKKVGFGRDGTVEIERFRFFNPPILVDDENGDIVRTRIHPQNGQIVVRKLRRDPLEALKAMLSASVSLTAMRGDKIIPGKIGNTVSTFYSSAGTTSPCDGTAAMDLNNMGWSPVRNGAGNSGDSTSTELTMHTFKISNEFKNDRVIINYDTSPISTDTISSVVISLCAGGFGVTNPDSTNFTFQACTPAGTNQVVAGDYDGMTINSPTEFLTSRFAFSSWVDTAGTYNNFTFNASGIAGINKVGVTSICWRNGSLDIDDVAPTGDNLIIARAADVSGTASDPKLVVTHAPGGPVNVATWNGLALSSTSSINDLSTSNISTINGLN